MGYFGMKASFAWIFSRKPTLEDKYLNHCKEELLKYGVEEDHLTVIKQDEVFNLLLILI